MLDIRFIRENPDLVAEKARQKGYDVDITQLLGFDKERTELLQKVEDLRRQRNELTKNAEPSNEDKLQGRQLKDQLVDLEHRLKTIELEYKKLLQKVPNVFPDDTPIGDETANREEKKWGEIGAKNFEIKDHLTWAEERGLVDFERGAKVAGNKFYYLKSDLVKLELALIQFGLEFITKKGFYPMSVPHMVNSRIIEGAGFSARGDEKQIYKIEDEDLNLIATAEIPLTGFFADEIIPLEWLPSPMAGWSPSYRVEGGAYGKYNRGLFRTHQFNKWELYIYCQPKDSEGWHQKLLAIEEDICQTLQIPYRVVRIASRDLGAPAYKKYDIEYWSPLDKSYRELMSASNVTDFQARNLNIRYRKEDGTTDFVHTLNATAIATSRMLVAIIENHQDKDGSVKIPQSLQKYTGDKSHI